MAPQDERNFRVINKPMNLVRALATIGGLTLVSRVLGFVRDMLMARFVGAGFASDAFLVAWRLPNLFRALFAEGAFSAAFVPMFNRIVGREHESLEPGLLFAERVLAVLFPVLVIFTAAMMLLAAPIVWTMTGGFAEGGADPAKFALATLYTRITFPYLALISLTSLLGGILNSLHRFWVNAAAPILLNLCLIAGLLFFRGHSDTDAAYTQSLAVTLSGVFQLGWLILACRQAGVVLRLRAPALDRQVKELLRLVWPAALGAGALQFNLLVSTTLAARYLPQGSVSYLYYADRLNQLPLGLIGIGMGTAILPSLSRMLGAGDEVAANRMQNRAIELTLLLALPATAALMVAAVPIIRALLQHGAFTSADTIASAGALAAFSAGLPAYILIKVLTPGFYARADTRTPVRIAIWAMLVNLALNLIVIWPLRPYGLGHVGLAFTTAVAAWVNVVMLYRALRRRGELVLDDRLKRSIVRLLGATAAMAAALIACEAIVDRHMAGALIDRVAWLGGMIAIGGLVYFGAALLLGAFDLAELKGQLRRGRA